MKITKALLACLILLFSISCKEDTLDNTIIENTAIEESQSIIIANSFDEIKSSIANNTVIELDNLIEYEFTEPINVADGNNIIINGNNATIKASLSQNLKLFSFIRSKNIEIRDLNIIEGTLQNESTLSGDLFFFEECNTKVLMENISVNFNFDNVATGPNQSANVMRIRKSEEVTVDNVRIKTSENYPNSTFNRLSAIHLDIVERVTVKNCVIENTRGNGIIGFKSSYCVIDGNKIFNSGSNGIIFGGTQGTGATDFNVIKNNYIRNTLTQNGIFVTADTGTDLNTTATISHNTIRDNIVENAGDIGIESGIRAFNTIITGNRIIDSGNISIIIRDNKNFIVSNNTCIKRTPFQDFHANIQIDSQIGASKSNSITDSHSVIKDNLIIGTLPGGIRVIDVNHINIEGNFFEGVTTEAATVSSQRSRAILLLGNIERINVSDNEIIGVETGMFISGNMKDIRIINNTFDAMEGGNPFGIRFNGQNNYDHIDIHENLFHDNVVLPLRVLDANTSFNNSFFYSNRVPLHINRDLFDTNQFILGP